MKNSRFFRRLCAAFSAVSVLSLAAALIPAAQRTANEAFIIGFPLGFLTIRAGQDGAFSTHLALSGLLADLCLGYALCLGAERLWKKRKSSRGETADQKEEVQK